jgi:putative flippase GtrA
VIATSSLSHREHPVRQFVRFLVVGAGNTLLSFVAYRLLLEIGTPYVVAAPVAFGIGALNGYIFNRRWTFAAKDSTQARVYYLSIAAGGAISTTLFVLVYVEVAGIGRVLAYLLALIPVTVSTFVANRIWTFAERP